jgi:hypothetical protein
MMVLSTTPLLLANAKKSTATQHYTTSTAATAKPKRAHNASPTTAAANPVKQQQHDLAKLEAERPASGASTAHARNIRTTEPHTKASEFNYRNEKGAAQTEKNIPRARIDRVQKKP